MEWKLHPRIIGACLVGLALVAGAYVVGTFGESNFEQQTAAVATNQSPRVAIAVTDNDGNGIEDWRDEFITTAPLVVTPVESTYVPPTTLTGQLGIDFMEDYIRSKQNGPFGRDQAEVVNNAVDVLAQNSAYTLYDTPDITIISNASDANIVSYANTAALTITNNNLAGLESEINILGRALQDAEPNTAALAQVTEIANAYAAMRDNMLATPVPITFAKAHLDLINTYHALHEGINAMAQATEDPALALVRLKRYQDDATGLQLALENMYLALEPYASLVGPEDPALLFVIFSSEFNS